MFCRLKETQMVLLVLQTEASWLEKDFGVYFSKFIILVFKITSQSGMTLKVHTNEICSASGASGQNSVWSLRGNSTPSAADFIRSEHFNISHAFTSHQCRGKLILTVMHYNIALLPKKVTNYVTCLLFMEMNVLYYICVTF